MIKSLLTVALLSSAPCMFAFAEATSETSTNSLVLLEIDGTKLTLSDFEKARPAGLFHARNVFHEAQQKAMDEYVEQYLLERQAKKEGVTVDKLLEIHVNNAIEKDPPESALKVYYEGVDTQQPFDAVKDQILNNVRERRKAKVKKEYMAKLHAEASVRFHLAPPRAAMDLKETPIRGPKNAQVTVVEYADYECPYCQQIQPVLDRLESEFKGKVAFAYKDVPLPMHSHAQKAAEAARCAGEQGKYWEMHDMLYATKMLDLPQLKEHARKLSLNAGSFDKCLDSGATAEPIKASMNEGQSFGLQGTPSFFINGRLFSGGLTFEQLKAVMDEEIAGASKATAQK
jgi:predicted DsbA family dithiol-disulfide isomerase